MEYIPDACRLTDIKKIEEMGLSVKEVARSVCEVFAAQMFEMGFLQADGHPSNVLIRKHPNGKRGQHEVVLIGEDGSISSL
jgi:aarF domain-containing kinase